MMGKDSILGSLLVLSVELWKGIAGRNNNQKNIYRGTYSYPNWLFGCSAWGTEPTVLNRCGMLVFNKNIIWNVLTAMISTRK